MSESEDNMYSTPMMFPLDPDGILYSLEDENGNRIGVGSREVCQTLLHLITHSSLMRRPSRSAAETAIRHRKTAKVQGARRSDIIPPPIWERGAKL